MSKKKVICDTNIWYDVSFNKLALNKNEFHYCATITNIIDFISSDKINGTHNERKALKNAILCMEENADEIIFHDPTTEARRLLYDIKIPEEEISGSKENYDGLLKYAHNKVNGIYGPAIDSLTSTKKGFQELTLSLKIQFDQKFGKTQNYSVVEKDIIRGNIAKYLDGNFTIMNGYKTDITKINLNKISVFISSFCEYLEDVKAHDIPNKNSMVDFYQLLYLGDKENLFWTTEPRINNKIIKGHTKDEVNEIIYEKYLNNI